MGPRIRKQCWQARTTLALCGSCAAASGGSARIKSPATKAWWGCRGRKSTTRHQTPQTRAGSLSVPLHAHEMPFLTLVATSDFPLRLVKATRTPGCRAASCAGGEHRVSYACPFSPASRTPLAPSCLTIPLIHMYLFIVLGSALWWWRGQEASDHGVVGSTAHHDGVASARQRDRRVVEEQQLYQIMVIQ